MLDLLATQFATGHIVDFILLLLAVEAGILYGYHRQTGGGIAPLDVLLNNLAGAGLLLALRAALTGAAWSGVAVWLLAALAAHIFDVKRRWRSAANVRD